MKNIGTATGNAFQSISIGDLWWQSITNAEDAGLVPSWAASTFRCRWLDFKLDIDQPFAVDRYSRALLARK